MPPFTAAEAVVSAFKDKIDALAVHGDRLYVGTAAGNLHIYGIDDSHRNDQDPVHLVDVRKNLSRKSIEQLAFIKDINSLVCLSDAVVTLYPLPNFSRPTVLTQTKTAFSFGLSSSVQHLLPDGKPEPRVSTEFAPANTSKAIPTLVTNLIVGCRRKVVVYTWKDGEPQEVKEAPLPHSPRTISFIDANTACFTYPGPEHAIFSMTTMIATEVATPLSSTSSVMGGFSGLTGYMTLGLGAKQKFASCRISDTEVLVVKDNEGYSLGSDGKSSRSTFVWTSPPEEIAYIKPYIISILPPAPASSTAATSSTSSHTINVRSSISPLPTQSLLYPFDSPSATSAAMLRLLTTSSSTAKIQSFFLVSTPLDRTAAASEGTTIWRFNLSPWLDQIEEMVLAEEYTHALTLLGSLSSAIIPDQEKRIQRLRALDAISQFKATKYDDALNTFVQLEINPAKVVALYPESIAGRLSVPQEDWIPMYGGPRLEKLESSADVSEPLETAAETSGKEADEGSGEKTATEVLSAAFSSVAASNSIRGRFKGLGGLIPTTGSRLPDDDAASVHSVSVPSKATPPDPQVELNRSVEALIRFLPDRRAKLGEYLNKVHITPEESHKFSSLSEISVEDLFAIPSAPMHSLTPEQLLRCAQVVDTALFKSYLMVRPGLIGSLCRRYNWCEVSEIEEELQAREKYQELIDLYNGKRMHIKALNLLRHLSENKTDMQDKLGPSISYLQKLGPEHIEQIFEASKWLFDQDQDTAFEIFTSEDVELPREAVADYLQRISLRICTRYVEFLIEERGEISAQFHDRLAQLYLNMTREARSRGDSAGQAEYYHKLLTFIKESQYYNIDRLYGQISSDDLYEARAVLLGRMGRHDQALELYVYRLSDYSKAEDYCKHIYQPEGSTSRVFLTLLRTYLQPTVKTSANLLEPALDLICKHSPRLDAVEALQLIPPLVTTQEIQAFLKEALRAPVFDSRIVRNISKARSDQVARRLMMLQSKRVVVTESRICPNCHKRIGNSVIAVQSPRGEVTHYQCREAFAAKLNKR